MPRIVEPQRWADIQKGYESGQTARALARQFGVSHTGIAKRAAKEGWSQDSSGELRRKTLEKVAGLREEMHKAVSPKDADRVRQEAVSAEADRRADVWKRQREEPTLIRRMYYAAIRRFDQATTRLERLEAAEDLRAAKLAGEAMTMVHKLERQAWGLDEPDQAPPGPLIVEVVYGSSS
jgi:hypothetical protein